MARPHTPPNQKQPDRHPADVDAGDVRALRVLALLEAETDEETWISSTALRDLLAEPPEPELPPIYTSRSSIRRSIDALRTAGYVIHADNHRGFSLATRPIPTSDLARIVRSIWTDTSLATAERLHLARTLSTLAGATLRRRIERLIEQTALEPGDPHSLDKAPEKLQETPVVAVDTIEELVRLAIDEGAPLAFELDARPRIPQHGTLREHGELMRLRPQALEDIEGVRYVTGYVLHGERGGRDEDTGGDTAPLSMFRLDRMGRVRAALAGGAVALARGAPGDAGHEQMPCAMRCRDEP